MAKRRVNVSEAIRSYLKANPKVGPKDAAAAISKDIGKKVTPIYVSTIKSNMKGKGKKKRGPKPGRAHQNGKSGLDLQMIEGFMAMVRRMGKENAKRLMELFE